VRRRLRLSLSAAEPGDHNWRLSGLSQTAVQRKQLAQRRVELLEWACCLPGSTIVRRNPRPFEGRDGACLSRWQCQRRPASGSSATDVGALGIVKRVAWVYGLNDRVSGWVPMRCWRSTASRRFVGGQIAGPTKALHERPLAPAPVLFMERFLYGKGISVYDQILGPE